MSDARLGRAAPASDAPTQPADNRERDRLAAEEEHLVRHMSAGGHRPEQIAEALKLSVEEVRAILASPRS